MKKLRLLFAFLLLLTFWTSCILAQDKNTRIDVLYFHATARCQGCLTIEDNINKSVNSLYAEKLKDSTIILRSIDFLQDENQHFQDDYKFDTQALIISKKVGGKEVKWKNLDKIWDYMADYKKFENYIKTEINNLLKES